jgi:CRP-like cAMP-binding protein
MSSGSLSVHFECVEIFQGLDRHQISEIARHSERIVYRPGQQLIENGTPGDSAILVVTGTAVRTAWPGAELGQVPEPVEPGSLIGEMAMLIETEHSSTIVAETEVRALKINRQDLLAQMHDDPTVAEHFMAKIAARLHRIAGELRRIDDILVDASTSRGQQAGRQAKAAAETAATA